MASKKANKKQDQVKIVGQAYKEPKKRVKKYAEANLNVLFVGETGSGKEVFGNYYIANSGRSEKNCLTVNCAGVSDELVFCN